MGKKKPSSSTLLIHYVANSLVKNLPNGLRQFTNHYLQYQGLLPKKKIRNTAELPEKTSNQATRLLLEDKQPTSLFDLNKDVLGLIGSYLPEEKTKLNIALTNKGLYSLFYSENPEKRLLNKIMELIATGEQARAEKFLSNHPQFAVKKVKYTDWCGRTFECSPFEYAIWALDIKYMGNMIVKCLPKTAEGEKIRLELLAQLNEMQQNGLSYTLEGVKHEGEKHFDLTPLKNALQTYATDKQTRNMSKTQLIQYWCHNVGGEQKLLPVYLRQEYLCPHRSFSPPKFDQEHFQRSLQFTDWTTNREGTAHQIWNKELVGLGDTYAIYGGTDEPERVNRQCGARDFANTGDYESLVALEDTRLNKDLPALQKLLEIPLIQPNIQTIIKHLGF